MIPPSKILRFILYKIKLLFIEKKYNGRLKYVFENNNSDKLIIAFSGFPSRVPKYNYRKTLNNVKVDKLFILDDFAGRGNYYWYENGKDYPKRLVEGLIHKVLGERKYDEVSTIGSSKGGTCAIFYGLEFNVTEILASACQYHIGDYLYTLNHKKIFFLMMGKNAGEKEVEMLNNMLPRMIKEHAHSTTKVHLCYSELEHTYQEHIVDLISDLEDSNISVSKKVDKYNSHGENGYYFSVYLKEHFLK